MDRRFDVLRDRFGIEQHELEWFRSYHTERSQTFKTPDNSSGLVSLMRSVPQGSRISPLEFVVNREDMADKINSFNINHHFYADNSHNATTTAHDERRRRGT